MCAGGDRPRHPPPPCLLASASLSWRRSRPALASWVRCSSLPASAAATCRFQDDTAISAGLDDKSREGTAAHGAPQLYKQEQPSLQQGALSQYLVPVARLSHGGQGCLCRRGVLLQVLRKSPGVCLQGLLGCLHRGLGMWVEIE